MTLKPVQDLDGFVFIITRPKDKSHGIVRKIRARGGKVLLRPCIEIVYTKPPGEEAAMLARMDDFDWLVFLSVNAVNGLNKVIKGKWPKHLPKVAAIGPATAAGLEAMHIEPDFLPSRATGKALAQELSATMREKPAKILMACGNLVSPETVSVIRGYGHEVQLVHVYENIKPKQVRPIEDIEKPYILFFSPSAFKNFLDLYEIPGQARLISIGPATTSAIVSCGYKVYKEADVHTAKGILEVLP
ncbi:MAG: uroporphyrinogen-III synthase [Deltaproteobacteria bacterium]|nr:uroporphyrinogen-III synthase [Deltaproteobacteria bacterium]